MTFTHSGLFYFVLSVIGLISLERIVYILLIKRQCSSLIKKAGKQWRESAFPAISNFPGTRPEALHLYLPFIFLMNLWRNHNSQFGDGGTAGIGIRIPHWHWLVCNGPENTYQPKALGHKKESSLLSELRHPRWGDKGGSISGHVRRGSITQRPPTLGKCSFSSPVKRARVQQIKHSDWSCISGWFRSIFEEIIRYVSESCNRDMFHLDYPLDSNKEE